MGVADPEGKGICPSLDLSRRPGGKGICPSLPRLLAARAHALATLLCQSHEGKGICPSLDRHANQEA